MVPFDAENSRTEDTVMGGLNSGYIRRALDQLPKQGSRRPWKIVQDYVRDVSILRYGAIADEALRFSRQQPRPESRPVERPAKPARGRTAQVASETL